MGSAKGALIPYYQMDSLAFHSSDIVFAQELGSVQKKTKRGNYEYDYIEARFRVLRVCKGSITVSHQNRYYLNSRFGPKYRKSSRP